MDIAGSEAIGPITAFLVFDMADQLGTIVNARIRLNGRLYGDSEDDNETLVVYEVSTAIETLRLRAVRQKLSTISAAVLN